MDITKQISRIDRMRSNSNGNPRYRVTFTDGETLPTRPDSQVAYIINNPEHRDVPVLVKLTGGQITDIKPAPRA